MAGAQPRVVAELGRPETPAETAARKAQSARSHRTRQTLRNLLGSLGATLLIVLVIVLLVPRSNTPLDRDIDVAEVAAQAQAATDEPLAVPELPGGWRSNAAELRTGAADGVTAWYAGYLTPGDEYIGMWQGLDANPTWVAELLKETLSSTTTSIGGIDWAVYDNRSSSADVGNARYALVAEAGGSTFVVLGTATPDEFAEFALAVAPAVQAAGARS
jgi:hypothetical protein